MVKKTKRRKVNLWERWAFEINRVQQSLRKWHSVAIFGCSNWADSWVYISSRSAFRVGEQKSFVTFMINDLNALCFLDDVSHVGYTPKIPSCCLTISAQKSKMLSGRDMQSLLWIITHRTSASLTSFFERDSSRASRVVPLLDQTHRHSIRQNNRNNGYGQTSNTVMTSLC